MILQRVVIGLAVILLSGVASIASAHKVNVFAYVEGNQVYIQGYFSDGTKAKNSDVTVYGADGRELLKGQTNEEGEFTFPSQGPGRGLRIVLNAGMGHQAAYEIPADEMTDVPAAAEVDPPASAKVATTGTDKPARMVSDSGAPAPLSEATVRKAVAEGVLPLAREISELKERRGFSDIVGGIGLIVGILGVFAYFKARQEARRVKGKTEDRAG
jgi:nickel transport protein